MCEALSFDASFGSICTFFLDFLPKFSERNVFIYWSTLPNVLSGGTNKKSKRGFVMRTGLPGEAVDCFSSYACS